jgi:membrane-bound inhibitor of C-type lysozyme
MAQEFKCFFGFHKWKPIKTQHYKVTYKYSHKMEQKSTTVTYQCSHCSTLKTKYFQGVGHLTLEDIK